MVEKERLEESNVVLGHEDTLRQGEGLDEHVGLLVADDLATVPLLDAALVLLLFRVHRDGKVGKHALPCSAGREHAAGGYKPVVFLGVADANTTNGADGKRQASGGVNELESGVVHKAKVVEHRVIGASRHDR